MNAQIRIGFGYDVHSFAQDRKLILGGVEIPSKQGLLGHSDADVLLHAICDAMLGALALGDIGRHFPNSDKAYKNIDSKILLNKVYKIINEKEYQISNIDSTVIMEEPKLSPYIEGMRSTISDLLDIDIEQISIKATTSERLGFIGRQEGASAYAVVLLTKKVN